MKFELWWQIMMIKLIASAIIFSLFSTSLMYFNIDWLDFIPFTGGLTAPTMIYEAESFFRLSLISLALWLVALVPVGVYYKVKGFIDLTRFSYIHRLTILSLAILLWGIAFWGNSNSTTYEIMWFFSLHIIGVILCLYIIKRIIYKVV